jgi:hypothetical protein
MPARKCYPDARMTKIQVEYDLQRPLDEQTMARIAAANSVYGIERIAMDPSGNRITVEYDASRLNPMEVETVLLRRGIPVIAHA